MTAARGEAMLQLFQMKWADLSHKMPELAEAGYTSLWLPVPAKGGSVFSVGYDLFDPFDLGDKNQNGTIPTKYGTKAELLEMVETAHRFGLRVYFDNIMNHRQGVVPGYDVYTPTNFFPGLWPQDFHLRTTSSGNRNWPNVENWSDPNYVQHQPINGLCDLAAEPGGINYNFGPTSFSQAPKPFFVRQPGNPEYYMDTNAVALGSWSAGSSPGFSWLAGTWHPFNGTNGQPVPERVEDYLTRAAMWTLYTTRCDGFRLDAVKHVPSPFFGDYSTSWRGYLGGIQAIFDFTHGYGNNAAGNGYVESDDNRSSCFDTEAARNDAMLFGEHLGTPPSYGEYISTGMRLLNSPLRTVLNGSLQGGGSLPPGLDQRDFIPYGGAFSGVHGVQFAEDHDHLLCCPTHREMQNAYYFMREGLPMIYSDNFNWAGDPGSEQTFPQVPMTRYLGQYGDNTMPETAYLHHQLARGGTRPRWSDSHIVAFERYDYRDVSGSDLERYNNPDATVVLFALNATYNNPSGDVLFDDGVVQTSDGYYNCYNGSPSKGVGLVVGFPPGSVLSQMAASSPNGGNARTCARLLVHAATTNQAEASSTANHADPAQRKIYVGGQSLAPGGGAIELLIPAGGWVMYGYQWPEPSRANILTNVITFRQGGAPVPTLLVTRRDGSNGDPDFGPVYPFKMRGGVDSAGNALLAPGEGNVSSTTNTYAIRIPVLTNVPFDILLRSDASASSMMVKLDGGLDLNSQMGIAPTTGFDRRDNKPGYTSDVFLGYEQALPQFRYGPEKFGARDVARDTVLSSGAETYKYTVGTTNTSVVNGLGGGLSIKTQTADWVYHDPAATNTAKGRGTPTQRIPYHPSAGQPVDIWVKAGYQSQIDNCFIYYTTDGTNPEGAFGVGKGSTQVVQAWWQTNDVAESTVDWWKGTIPAQAGSPEVRYKVALFKGGQSPISAISDADSARLYGLTQFGITNFNPATAAVWLHNNLRTNDTVTGLRSGFHIVRARPFLPRSGKSGVYNTFLQTFYYAGQLPGGVVAYPAADGNTLTGSSYTVVVRADSSTTAVDYCITDANGQNCGTATAVSPDGSLGQQYPNYPREFRFTYSPVATRGTAAINVYLKDTASSVYPGRYNLLTRTVNAQGPATVLNIVSPSADGQVLTLNSNDTYTISACFTSTLTTNNYNLFSLYLNGVFQPRHDANSNLLYNIRPTGCGAGLRWFFYNWKGFSPGTNVIHLAFTNTVTLSDTRTVLVGIRNSPLDTDGDTVPDWLELLAGTDPGDPDSFLRLTHLVPDTPVEVTWASVPGRTYQVHATTNLHEPMQPIIGAVVPAHPSDSVTRWFDSSSGATNRFYRVQVLP